MHSALDGQGILTSVHPQPPLTPADEFNSLHRGFMGLRTMCLALPLFPLLAYAEAAAEKRMYVYAVDVHAYVPLLWHTASLQCTAIVWFTLILLCVCCIGPE